MSTNDPFVYSYLSDPQNALLVPGATGYPPPNKQIYNCSFSGQTTIQPYSTNSETLCVPGVPNSTWSGSKVCSWSKQCWKSKWGIKICGPVLKCSWAKVCKIKATWICETIPSINILPTTTVKLKISTQLNINQLDPNFRLTTTVPSSDITLTNLSIVLGNFNQKYTFNTANGPQTLPTSQMSVSTSPSSSPPKAPYPNLPPCNFKAVNFTTPPSYLGNYPISVNISPGTTANTTNNGSYTIKTYTKIDFYIDKTNTASWMYFKVVLTVEIWLGGSKQSSTTNNFNLNLDNIELH